MASEGSEDPEPAAAVGEGASNGVLPPRRRWRQPPWSVITAFAASWVLLTGVYAVSPVSSNGDSYLVIPTAHSLLYDHDIGLDEFMADRHIATHYGLNEAGVGPPLADANGKPMNYFPWLTAVFSVPVIGALDLVSSTGLIHNSRWYIDAGDMDLIQVISASVTTGLAAALLALVSAELLLCVRSRRPKNCDGDDPGAGLPDGATGGVNPRQWWFLPAAALAIGLSTSLWSTASRAMWQHGPALCFLAVATWAVLRLAGGHRGTHRAAWAVVAGAASVAAYWARPTTAAVSVALIGVLAVSRRDALAAFLGGAAATTVVFLALNQVLVGRLVPVYYSSSRVGLHAEFAEAVAGNLISPARGLFLFSPCLLLAGLLFLPSRWQLLSRELRVFVTCSAVGCILFVLGVSGFPHWWGGYSYGPRFTTELVVLLGPLALFAVVGPRANAWSRASRAVVWVLAPALLAISVGIHFGGAWSRANACWNLYPVSVDEQPSRIWDWSDPQALLWISILFPPGACDRAPPAL